jgi:hypothetical protein
MSRISRKGGLPATAALIVLTVTQGCCQYFVDPFRDELANRPGITTPSVQVAHSAQVERTVLRRPYARTEVFVKDGTVTHGPLYFEDPFEDKGSEDGKFAWTGEDYLQMGYWRGRFLLNGVLFPVSVIVTPPWVLMASDGRLSQQALGMDHDAERWVGTPAAEQSGESVN